MPAYPVSGITGLPSSGILPVSGSQSGYDGPWLIESQDLTIQYVRVPKLVSGTSIVTSLSATASRSENVGATELQCIVRASYRRYRENNTTYLTSAWMQPQRFTIQAQSTDAFGNSYGTVSGTILGPAGRVITSQPFYRRVLWTSATSATEISQAVTVANIGFRELVIGQDGLEWVGKDAIQNQGNFNTAAALSVEWPNAYVSVFDPHPLALYGRYPLVGPYNTGLESQAEFRQFIDDIGTALYSQFMLPTVPSFTAWGSFSGYTGLTYYRPERHDFS
jgi:hypothetical protein